MHWHWKRLSFEYVDFLLSLLFLLSMFINLSAVRVTLAADNFVNGLTPNDPYIGLPQR